MDRARDLGLKLGNLCTLPRGDEFHIAFWEHAVARSLCPRNRHCFDYLYLANFPLSALDKAEKEVDAVIYRLQDGG